MFKEGKSQEFPLNEKYKDTPKCYEVTDYGTEALSIYIW